MLIDTRYFIARIGTKAERKHDRRFLVRLYMMQWNWQMKAARESGNYAAMDQLDRDYEMMAAL